MLNRSMRADIADEQPSADLHERLESEYWRGWNDCLDRDRGPSGLLIVSMWMVYGICVGILVAWIFIGGE